MTCSALPIWFVDTFGSVLMIIFSILCIRIAKELRRRDEDNLVWTYIFWLCICFAGFAVSRSAGHILKQMLIISGNSPAWETIRPYSGAVNTFLLIIVAAITLFFERVQRIYAGILSDRQELRSAHARLLNLNENLEQRVLERTEALAQSEKQIAQADRLASIGQLSSGIAHEINNPLGVILGYAQLLIRNESPDSQRYEDLKTIERHVKSCKTIVEDLLNFARSSKPKIEEGDIHSAIDDVLSFVQHQSKSESLKLETDYDPKIPKLRIDEKKIKQVIVNLIMNAIHAVNQTGTIWISTRYDPDAEQVLIRVKDTGHGIQRKDLPRIFDPFFTTKPTGEGTGLGLAVSYGIIKNHGGDITAAGESGNGAEFTITLPAGDRGLIDEEENHSNRR